MKFSDLPDRVRANTFFDRKTNCWIWLGAGSRGQRQDKYGHIGIGGKTRSVHRVVYEMLVGPIPEGLELDHVCKNTLCCNPIHLEPVPHRENTRRGEAGKYQTLKTHCPQGHEYTPGNTYLYLNRRTCRICARAKSLRFYREHRDGVNEKRYAKRRHKT